MPAVVFGMANSASLQLHELISSMSRSEKRYFKLYIRTHASKHEQDYVELFQLVEQQDYYDEESVIVKLEKSGPIQRFAVLKHRLFEKILDALESYQRSKDEGMRLRHEINRANVLLKRGMHKVGLSVLCKVEEAALRIEAFETAIEARALYVRCEDIQGHDRRNNLKDIDQVLKSIKHEHELIELRNRLQLILREHGRTANGKEKLAQIEVSVNGIKSDSELSPKSAYLAEHVLALLKFAKTNILESLKHLKRCQEILEANSYLSEDMPLVHADIWANETYCHLMIHDIPAAKESLLKLLGIEREDLAAHLHIAHQGVVMQSLLFYLNRTGDEGLSQQLQANIDSYRKSRWDHAPLIRAGIDYGLGLYYHNFGDSGRALRCLNRVLNDGEVRRDEDIYHRTLVLITLLHAESGDRTWMVHSARALKRYLVPRNLLQGTDALLLEYISDYRRSRSEEGEYRALSRFAEGLRGIRKNDKDRIAFEHFDFLAWAEDHLKNLYPTNKVA
jgi:tetratricopeptide (TPR) repeat protein